MENVSNYKRLKCSCWHPAHCGLSCCQEECYCTECDCILCKPLQDETTNPDVYQVYPDDDGYDTPKNPYSQH